MKKIIYITTAIALSAFFIGCASTNEHLGAINTSDLNEADFVREVLGQNPSAKGNFSVTPGSTVTTVHILNQSKPENEEAMRASLIGIKDTMRQSFGREPNTLRFIFEEVTIEE
jgi:hypothetical protein